MAPETDTTSDTARLAVLRAHAARRGITLTPSRDGAGRATFTVSRWALTKELPDLDAVEVWLRRVAGDTP